MADKETLLKLRTKLKRKKPTFLRQDAHKAMRVAKNWRKPRGLQSKMRLHKKGYCRSVEMGWSSPNAVRGLSREGLELVNISTMDLLLKLDPKNDKLIIKATVGLKKRLELLKKAVELGFAVHNYVSVEKFIQEKEDMLKKKKEITEKKKTERSGKRAAAKKDAEKKKKDAEKKDAEKAGEEKVDDNKKEKKEQDKVLISKKTQ
ncbi:50S ribosomal protein L32e [Candidatus Woesearchaeota archaeon]|jgi:large subunit ribosomal protein L32e|nr:50S ribosomal protein L32e [Candidatus Woesearchaeota archaeon]